jgi:3-(3-hydroxy-phenyl)propionate hydroxylase
VKKSYDVIIVGAGPVGLTFANFIAGFGHSVCVFEKENNLFPTPRAVAVDDESLRIWQQIKLLDEMQPYLEYGDEGDEVLTYLNASGKKLMSIRQHGKQFGYPKGAVILQHEIDKILLNGLNRFPKKVDVLFGHEVQGFNQTNDDVSVSAIHNGQEIKVVGKYLIACDGGRSGIRKQLGIRMNGFTYQQSWLIIDTIEERKERIGAQVFCNPAQPIATIPLPQNHRRFEIFLKDKFEPDSFSENDAKAALEKLNNFKIKKILRHLVYTFNARVSQKYKDGRVFLAGDACHVTPPFAGQGLATGLRDAANLSWKVSERLNNHFEDSLFDTYEQERRPHQERMIKLAVMLGKFMTPKNKLVAFLRGAMMSMVSKIKPLRNLVELRGQNIQPVYKRGFVKNGNMAGKYFPQPVFDDGMMADEMLGDKFTIVTFGINPSDVLCEQEIGYWKNIGADFLDMPNDKIRFFGDFVDITKNHLFILRPDRIIYQHYQA